jgi:hypothetical protein
LALDALLQLAPQLNTIITMSRKAILAEAGDATAFANDIAQAADQRM